MILTENPYPYNPKPTPNLSNTGYNAFNAGAKAQLKKVVEWLTEDCTEHPLAPHGLPYTNNRYDCNECWQALLEEVKE